MFERVGDHDVQARIVEHAFMDMRQMDFAQIHDPSVDIDEIDPVDALMLQDFLCDRPIAAADDHRRLHIAMFHDRRMGQHFRIRRFIAFGDLNDAVQRHHVAEGDGVEHLDMLERAMFIGERRIAHGDALRIARMKFFFENA